MSNDQNPYAPPMNPYAPPAKRWEPVPGAPGPETMWREGEMAVMYKTGGRLPDRCVRCNESVTKRLAKTLYWHPPAVFLGLLCGVLPFLILSFIMRQSTTIDFGLCEAHASRRLLGMFIGIGGFLGALAFMCQEIEALVFLGLALLFVAPITGAVMARTIVVKKIDEVHASFNVGRPFLESLPRND
jgi:hypothetical protein